MKLPKGNSFLTGFVFAILVVALTYVWWIVRFTGGHSVDSPNGAYSLYVTAPLNPLQGGTYTVELIQNSNESVLRRITVDLSEFESTPAVRENSSASIVWDANSSYADISIDGNASIRIWVP